MYVIKRTVRTQPGKAWEVAGYLTKICRAYEKEHGRNEAQVYIGGQGLPGYEPDELPGDQNVVYAQWTQERIEATPEGGVPEEVMVNHGKMATLMTEYTIEFYEMATQDKLEYRGFA